MRQGRAWLAGADTPTLDPEGEAMGAGMGVLPLGEIFLPRALGMSGSWFLEGEERPVLAETPLHGSAASR